MEQCCMKFRVQEAGLELEWQEEKHTELLLFKEM